MLNFVTEIIRYVMTLYFGVFVTTSIIGIKSSRKNLLILNIFCISDLLLHLLLMRHTDTIHVSNAYPLLTHLPLLLLLIPFCIMPFFYYIFDYAITVYTKLLYAGNHLVVEFVPFLMCICYLIFCVIYCCQYERQQQIATQNYFMQLKQVQYAREMESMTRL